MMASSTSNPNPWYLEQKYQDYWENLSRLNISQGNTRYSNPDDIRAIAYWRSLALSLQFENNQLHSLLSQMFGANNPGVAAAVQARSNGDTEKRDKRVRSRKNKTIKNNSTEELQPDTTNYDDNCDEEGEDLEDYLRFAAETERHRRERDRLKESNGAEKGRGEKFDSGEKEEEEEEVVLRQADLIAVDHERLKREMDLLFGKESLSVHCAETRLQLDFNEWFDRHRPVKWPALPFNIRK